MAMSIAMTTLVCVVAACGRAGTPAPVVTGGPALESDAQHECVHAHRPGRQVLALPAPAGGWSGHPQAVVVLNALSGEVDIRHGLRDRCGTLEDARTLDSRFRAGVGTVLVPNAGDTAPIEVEYEANPLPLWRPIVQLGEPAPVQRADIGRFAIRIASLAIVLTLVMSSLLNFVATRERGFLNFAVTTTLFAVWLALLSGLWAWPRPWLPVGGFAVEATIGLALALAGVTTLTLLRQSWLRRRVPRVEWGVRWLARASIIAGLSAKTVDGASAFSYPLIFLPFISSAFVPTDTMPGPVRWFAENQPVTSIVNTIQALLADEPVGSEIWVALAWCVGILIVAYAFAMLAYRRKVR